MGHPVIVQRSGPSNSSAVSCFYFGFLVGALPAAAGL